MSIKKNIVFDMAKIPKVPGALLGWEVKILVGNLAECRTILISVHSNQ